MDVGNVLGSASLQYGAVNGNKPQAPQPGNEGSVPAGQGGGAGVVQASLAAQVQQAAPSQGGTAGDNDRDDRGGMGPGAQAVQTFRSDGSLSGNEAVGSGVDVMA